MTTTPLRVAAAALLTTLLSPLALSQVTTAPGIQTAELLDVGDRSYATLSDGGYVSFDGLAFERYDAAGNLVQTYGTLPAFVFPSFVEVDAGETFAYAGESSNGDIFKIDLVAGTVTTLANMTFNYDFAFDATAGSAYISAALGGFGAGNDIVRIDLATGQWTQVAHVAGPSGPIAVDAAGDLYYVTIYDGANWPPPLAEEDMILWSDAQLDSGQLLTEADASYLTAGLDGGSSLAYDPLSGNLYLAHTNASGFENEILRISGSGPVLDSLGGAFTWISTVEVVSGSGPQVMAPFQPSGAMLRVNNVDFGGTIRDRVTLVPARATIAFSGPANDQPGQATITVQDAVPNGFVSIMLANSSDLTGQEVPFDSGWSVPAFFMVDPLLIWRRTQPLPTDAAGAFTLTYNQPGGLTGDWVFQAILFDASGVPVGTSTYVIND